MVPSDTVTCKHCADSHAFMVAVRRNLLKILRGERAAAATPKRRNALLRGITQLKAQLAEPAPTGCTWIQHHPKRFMI
jgi:hypothetical protein